MDIWNGQPRIYHPTTLKEYTGIIFLFIDMEQTLCNCYLLGYFSHLPCIQNLESVMKMESERTVVHKSLHLCKFLVYHCKVLESMPFIPHSGRLLRNRPEEM